MKVVSIIILFCFFAASIFSQNIDLRNPSDQYDYVVITKTNFVNEFDEFVEHKKNVKSLKCAVVTTDNIYSEFYDYRYPQQNIRGFISYAAKSWQEPQPRYFFIAGDINSIPNFRVEGVREIDTVFTDYYYAVDITSKDETKIDYYVGRLSARTNLELSNYLHKVIEYESTRVESWNNKVMLVGIDDNTTGDLLKERTSDFTKNLFGYLKPTVFLSPNMYNENELKNNIINGINIEGYSSVFLWSVKSNNQEFGYPLVLNMNNINEIKTGYYPFVSFLGQQKFSSSNSTGLLDKLLFNKHGAIAGFNVIAPFYVNAMIEFYKEFVRYLYSENGNSIAGAAVKAIDGINSSHSQYIRNDLFGVFGDPSIILKYDILASVTGNELKQNFELYQNYPNPFNPATQISFMLPESAFVKLSVYDLLGREVANLVDEEMESGEHTIDFNASSFSSGIYLYQLKAGDFNQTRKMILIK